mmetsp:Transcript_22306/g.56406  ORF Transcript_22306/g.56406 Transcript_22306/m.56406 type:complete len:103 (+) Transcript_22306:209-517(+)|eukprot:g1164.t1
MFGFCNRRADPTAVKKASGAEKSKSMKMVNANNLQQFNKQKESFKHNCKHCGGQHFRGTVCPILKAKGVSADKWGGNKKFCELCQKNHMKGTKCPKTGWIFY